MNLLTPRTGNQSTNRLKAIEYIADHILEVTDIDLRAGNIKTKDGSAYHISAFAESVAAFITTPGVDKSKYSIYASGHPTLMFRQIKKDKRSFIYEVDPTDILMKPNSSSADWSEIDKAAKRIWVCTETQVKCIDRTNKKK